MKRLDALRALYDAVKAGTATMHHFAAVWPSENAYGKTTWGTAHIAFAEKDVNAALAFIAATLPGAWWELRGPADCCARIWSLPPERHTDPAIALLLAGVAAHIAQEEGK